jgi:hypothetical protein
MYGFPLIGVASRGTKAPIVFESETDVTQAIKTEDPVEVDGTEGVIRVTAGGRR